MMRSPTLRTAAAVVAGAALTCTSAGLAYADDIANSLDVSIDAVYEVMPLTVGGADGTTTLYVQPRDGDGKNGCNLTGSTTLGVSISSSNPAVASVSPTSATFASCDDVKALTVTPHMAGTTNVTVAETSNTTGRSFDLDPAAFTVNVSAPPPPANTAPTVAVSGVTGGASYAKGAVPAATCDVSDAEDGNSSFAASLGAIEGPYAADGIGQQTASCSYTDGGGLTAKWSETYNIVDPSAPVISYVVNPPAPDGNNGWYRSNVSLDWTVTEPESPGSLNPTGCEDQNITADQAEQVYFCAADSAGGSATRVDVPIKRDATPPTVDASAHFSTGGTGYDPADPYLPGTWTNRPVVVHYSCSDALSGVADCPDPQLISGEGSHAVSGTGYDNAGNPGTSPVVTVNIDTTDPTITPYVVPGAPDGTNGWYVTAPTVGFSCADVAGSGIASCTGEAVLGEGSGQTVNGTAVDNAGNDAAAVAGPVNVDLTDPTDLAFVDGPASGASYYWGSVPAAPTCTAEGGVSGLASCEVTGYSAAVGEHVMTATATDNAGRTSQIQRSYTVQAWRLSGFYSPVDMSGVLNVAKGGSTVPLKFELFAAGELTNTSAVSSLMQAKVNCDGSVPVDEIEAYVTGGTSLRYDTTAGQFVYNWQTPKAPGSCYRVTLTTQDGSAISALFKLK